MGPGVSAQSVDNGESVNSRIRMGRFPGET